MHYAPNLLSYCTSTRFLLLERQQGRPLGLLVQSLSLIMRLCDVSEHVNS